MRRWLSAIAFAFVMLASACDGSEPAPEVSVGDILGGRVAEGTPVRVRGTVLSGVALPAAGAVSYRLADEGTSIVIVAATDSDAPTIASQVEITGVVRTDFRVDVPGQEAVTFGTVVEEVRRRTIIGEELSTSGVWIWTGGAAGVVFLGWLVAWAIIRRTSGSRTSEIGECRGCSREVEVSWVSCPWCGIKLDVTPPTPATMVFDPPAGRHEAPQEPSGTTSRPTIVLPPDGAER